MSTCRVISYFVGKGCLLWPACSLDKTVSLCPTLRAKLPVILGIPRLPTLHSNSLWLKGHLFLMLVLESVVGLHRTCHLQLFQHQWLRHRLGLLWYLVVWVGNKSRSFCPFWDCTQVLHFKICPFLLILVYWFLRCHIHSCHLLLDHIQFILINGPAIPGFYAALFFTALDFTFTTRHIHSWASFPLWPGHFILPGAISNCPLFFPYSILDTFWPKGLIFWCHFFFHFSCCSWGSPSKNTGVGCHFLLQWTMFRQNSSLWAAHLGWPWTAWLIA